jgi:hypothetical protein
MKKSFQQNNKASYVFHMFFFLIFYSKGSCEESPRNHRGIGQQVVQETDTHSQHLLSYILKRETCTCYTNHNVNTYIHTNLQLIISLM